MPRVAQYQPNQVRTQVAAQPQAQNVPDAAFGAPLSQGANRLAQAGVQMQGRIDTTASEAALVSFERDKNDMFFNADGGYFNTQGRDAYDGAGGASKTLGDLKEKYSETLSPSAKILFGRAADAHITRGQADIARHASKGLRAWEVATIESQVENTLENATLYWNDSERLKVQSVMGRQAILDSSDMLGLSPEATAEKIQTYNSSFASAIIEAATQSNSEAGKTALEDHGEHLEGPDRLKMEKEISKKAAAEKVASDAQMAILTAGNLVDTYENRSDIIEQVKKIKDLTLQKKTMTEAMTQFSQKRTAESEFQGDSFKAAEDAVLKDGTTAKFIAGNPEGWNSLTVKQQDKLQSGVPVSTDWVVFSSLMLRTEKELARVNPAAYFHDLGEAQRSQLINAVRTAKGKVSKPEKVKHQVGRSRIAQVSSAVRQLFGKRSKQDKEMVNTFYSMLDDEVGSREAEKDAKLTSEEFTGVLADFTRKVVVEGFIFNSEKDITSIPATDQQVLSDTLRERGVPVTADNLIKLYEKTK